MHQQKFALEGKVSKSPAMRMLWVKPAPMLAEPNKGAEAGEIRDSLGRDLGTLLRVLRKAAELLTEGGRITPEADLQCAEECHSRRECRVSGDQRSLEKGDWGIRTGGAEFR
jgi:hypothetical protein